MSHEPRPQRRPRRQSRELVLVSVVAGLAVVLLLGLGVFAERYGSRRPADAAAVASRAPHATPSRSPGIGDAVRDGDFEFEVTHVDCSHKSIGIAHFQSTAKGKYCVVSVAVRNIADGPEYFIGHAQKAVTAGGDTYRDDDIAAVYVNHQNQTFLRKLAPGRRVTGKLVFDVPATAELTAVELHDSLLSGGVTVTLG